MAIVASLERGGQSQTTRSFTSVPLVASAPANPQLRARGDLENLSEKERPATGENEDRFGKRSQIAHEPE